MVRHGRLSKGCQTCRKRKIKCDQLWPACNQCIKAGWKCPQYGDSVERMFQHQDLKDFNKSADQEFPEPTTVLSSGTSYQLLSFDASSSLENPIAMTSAETSNSTLPHYSSHVSLSKEIVRPISCRAMDFFFATHVFRESGVIRGYYEYLTIFKNDVRLDKRLYSSLSAVALAAYANTFQDPNLLKEARQNYDYAVQSVNTALSSRKEAVKDSTLVSVLLLSTFETLISKYQKSLSHIDAHMRGAMTIINLRGHRLVESRSGLQIFLQMCVCLFMTCLLQSNRIPVELIGLRRYAAKSLDTNDPAWKLSDIIVKLAKFRADVKERILGDYCSIVDAALEIDFEFSSLANDMPVQWRFETVLMKEKSELVFGTYYHVYPDLWVAFIWNKLRTCRLLLHKEIRNQLKDVFAISPLSFLPMDAFNLEHSTKTLQRMTFEICATVPQYSGNLSSLSGSLLQTEGYISPENIHSSKDSVTNGIPTTAGVYFLFWPLIHAGLMADSEMQRDWIIDRSRNIGRMTGIQHAFALVDILQRGENIFA